MKRVTKCEKSFMKGQTLIGPKGGEYIMVKPKTSGKQPYKRYCKVSNSRKSNIAQIMFQNKSLWNKLMKNIKQ